MLVVSFLIVWLAATFHQTRWRPWRKPPSHRWKSPTYHLLEGYDPKWKSQIERGVEMARDYWGSHGPAYVWILGNEKDQDIDPEFADAFIDEYADGDCFTRNALLERVAST